MWCAARAQGMYVRSKTGSWVISWCVIPTCHRYWRVHLGGHQTNGGTSEFLQVKPNLPWHQRQALTMTVTGKIKASLRWPERLRREWWWKYAFFHCILNHFVSKIVQLLFWNCLVSTHTEHLLMSPGIWGFLQIWGPRVLAWVVISPCLQAEYLCPLGGGALVRGP